MKDYRTGYLPGMDEKSWMEKIFSKPNLFFLFIIVAGIYLAFIKQQDLHAQNSSVASVDTDTQKEVEIGNVIEPINVLVATDSDSIEVQQKETQTSLQTIEVSKNNHLQMTLPIEPAQTSAPVATRSATPEFIEDELPSPVVFDSKLVEKLEDIYHKDIEFLE